MGCWAWQLLRAGTMRLDGGGMFGVVPRAIWSKLLIPDEINRVLLQTNCLLLRGHGRLVLIEAGFGDKWTERERTLYGLERRTVVEALREADITPEAITDIIVTHLHFDHAGGLTRVNPKGELTPTFSAAPVFLQRTEWEDALANKSTMTRTYLRSHLDPIKDRLRLIDGEGDLPGLPGMRVLPVPGHTWGMQAVIFEDDQGIMCFPGDLIPTIHHAGGAFSMAYDMMPHANMQTKQYLLARAYREKWRLVLDHEPGPAVVRVVPHRERPSQFELVPLP